MSKVKPHGLRRIINRSKVGEPRDPRPPSGGGPRTAEQVRHDFESRKAQRRKRGGRR